MVATMTLNPQITTVASGSFNIETTGHIQGTLLDNPPQLFAIAGGPLASSETLPMWGGVAIGEAVPPANPGNSLGGAITRATTAAGIRGWSVFNQNHSMLTTPQSPVPLALSGMNVNFVRLGSGARIAVACSPVLADLDGTDTYPTAVSWDFGAQVLTTYSAPTFSSGSYSSVTGLVTLVTTAGHGLAPGDVITVSGVTGTGADLAKVNGTFVLTTGTTGTNLVYSIGTGLTVSTITAATLSTGGNLTGNTILPVRVLDVQVGNSMTVSYDTVTGFAAWNRSGSTAVILI